jgi:hypothetical protein
MLQWVPRVRGTPIFPGTALKQWRVFSSRWLFPAILVVTAPLSPASNLDAGDTSSAPENPYMAVAPVSTVAFPLTAQGSVARFPRIANETLPSGTYTLPLGESATLRLPPNDFQPSISGAAVLLVPRYAESPTPYREWELRGVGIGVAELMVSGSSTKLTWRIEVR